MDDKMCCFGCGEKAKFVLKNGKACCSKSQNSCLAIRNKNRQCRTGHSSGMLGKKAWNSGKTWQEAIGSEKAKEILDKISHSLIGRSKGIGGSIDRENVRRNKIRDSINKRYESGWMPKAGRCKKIKYESCICGQVVLDGSWELEFARFLDKCGLKWLRNKIRFPYFFDGTWRYYTPDFFIPSLDVFVEVKGYKTIKDDAKWKQFPKNLRLVPIGKDVIKRIKMGSFRIDEIKEECANW